jgi:hypothetical protein
MSAIFGIPLVALEGAGMLLLLALLSCLGVWWLDRLLLCTRWFPLVEKPTSLHPSRSGARALAVHSVLYAMTDEQSAPLRCSPPVSTTVGTAWVSCLSLPTSADQTQRSGAVVHRHVPMALATRTARLPGTQSPPLPHIPPTTSYPASR